MTSSNDPTPPDARQRTAARLTVEMESAEIEMLVVTVAEQFLREHHVTIRDAKVELVTPTTRVLEAQLRIRARRGIATAKMRVTTQLVVDAQLVVRLSQLEIAGHGMLGRLAASFVRPRIPELLAQRWPLNTLTPAGICLQDIEMIADDALGIHVNFEADWPTISKTQKTGRRLAMLDDSRAKAITKRKPSASAGRLEIFVIDSGWNEDAKRRLDEHLKRFKALMSHHSIYRLTMEQSKLILEENPSLIGADPVLIICDNDARIEKTRQGYGCRLCLGAMLPDMQNQILFRVLRIVGDRTRTKKEILRQVRKETAKKGINGAI